MKPISTDFFRAVVVFDAIDDEVAEGLGHAGGIAGDGGRAPLTVILAWFCSRNSSSVLSTSWMTPPMSVGCTARLLSPEAGEIQKVAHQPFDALAQVQQAVDALQALLVQLALVVVEKETGMVVNAAQAPSGHGKRYRRVVEFLVGALEIPVVALDSTMVFWNERSTRASLPISSCRS